MSVMEIKRGKPSEMKTNYKFMLPFIFNIVFDAFYRI